jgi:hypothetical protein
MSVVEHLPSMREALNLVPSITHAHKNKKKAFLSGLGGVAQVVKQA